MSSRQAAKRRIGVKPAEAARAAPRRPLSNAEIADHFYRMAELLELRGGDIFRVLAYRRAAGVIQAMPETIDRFLARGRDLRRDQIVVGIVNDVEMGFHLGERDQLVNGRRHNDDGHGLCIRFSG